jgi:hypothetical protein
MNREIYLELSNIQANKITNDHIELFKETCKKDNRVKSLSILDRDHKNRVMVDINLVQKTGEEIISTMTLNKAAGELFESSSERRARLKESADQEEELLKKERDNHNFMIKKFVEIAKKEKATIEDLRRYYITIFSGNYANQDSKWWKSAESTIEKFTEFYHGKKVNFADFNFLRENFAELYDYLDVYHDAIDLNTALNDL